MTPNPVSVPRSAFITRLRKRIAEQQGNTEVENARLFMLVNVAMADAAITCWETKYYYQLLETHHRHPRSRCRYRTQRVGRRKSRHDR